MINGLEIWHNIYSDSFVYGAIAIVWTNFNGLNDFISQIYYWKTKITKQN